MVNAGRVAIVPQGEWSADATYKRLDAVTHNNTLYFAKKEVPAGTETTNTEYWSKSIVGGAGAIATTEDAGIVKPDGTTITIDDDGTIHGQSEITVDGTTITIDEAKGIISLAKTLQDKIKTIDNKLPKTSVVNTNTTTEAGFALDARQANPNIEGTVAANILQLNNDLSDLNGSLDNKIGASQTFYAVVGVTIEYKGVCLILISQDGAFGAALYFVVSTDYTFQSHKLVDSLSTFPIAFSSIDRKTGAFTIKWTTAEYNVRIIPLTSKINEYKNP